MRSFQLTISWWYKMLFISIGVWKWRYIRSKARITVAIVDINVQILLVAFRLIVTVLMLFCTIILHRCTIIVVVVSTLIVLLIIFHECFCWALVNALKMFHIWTIISLLIFYVRISAIVVIIVVSWLFETKYKNKTNKTNWANFYLKSIRKHTLDGDWISMSFCSILKCWNSEPNWSTSPAVDCWSNPLPTSPSIIAITAPWPWTCCNSLKYSMPKL